MKEKIEEQKIYSVRENWHLLRPFLNDEDVQKILNEAMTEFSEGNPNRQLWTPGDAPWEYTTSCYWHDILSDTVQEDEEFQIEQNELFQKLFVLNQNGDDENDLWDELLGTEEYQLLDLKYYNKHAPQKETVEWYQLIHGCHWINQFTAALISKALNVEVFVWVTDTHTIATFSINDVIFYADILNEWDNIQQLIDFMGDDLEYYCISELIEDEDEENK